MNISRAFIKFVDLSVISPSCKNLIGIRLFTFPVLMFLSAETVELSIDEIESAKFSHSPTILPFNPEVVNCSINCFLTKGIKLAWVSFNA